MSGALSSTGALVIWGLSAGRWRTQDTSGDKRHLVEPAGGLSFIQDGRRVVTDTGAQLVGVMFYGLLAFVAWLASMW